MPKIKVFESGRYPQGTFSNEKVRKIFSNISEPIKAIFSHTSKWNDKEPLEVGTFKDFEIREDKKGSVVYGVVDFNEKGLNYYNDKILKGVSVEIDNNIDKLLKIAVLPIGINPQVKGAEFEMMNVLEFEEEKIEETTQKDFSIEEVIEKYGKDYDITKKEIKEEVVKTEAEIREEVRKEFEKEIQVEKEVNDFMNKNKTKLIPAIKEFMSEEVLKVIFNNEPILEFSNGNINIKDLIVKLFDKLPNVGVEEFSRKVGEPKENVNDIEEIMAKAKKETEERFKK